MDTEYQWGCPVSSKTLDLIMIIWRVLCHTRYWAHSCSFCIIVVLINRGQDTVVLITRERGGEGECYEEKLLTNYSER